MKFFNVEGEKDMKTISTDKAPAAIGPYSQGKIHGSMIFVSGQIPVNPVTGKIAGNTIESQAEQSMKNVGEVLKAGGSDYSKVIKTTCFLADMKDFAVFNEVYEKYFISNPARSCVAVKELPKNCLCEVEAIALKE
jgi:2-iminobutanoate/2-iminopropanoate deaminase